MIIQEGDELLHRTAAAGESTCYIIVRDDGRVFNLRNKMTKTQIRKTAKEQNLIEGKNYQLYRYKTAQPFGFALHSLNNKLAELRAIDKDVKVALSCPNGNNFRYKSAIRLPYKGNRFQCAATYECEYGVFECGYPVKYMVTSDDGQDQYQCAIHGETEYKKEKPLHKQDLQEYLTNNTDVDIILCHNFEADDGLGLYHADECKIMSHEDKDIKMIPGKHYNWRTGEYYNITPQEGMLLFFKQLLMGDRTDNIPGCPYDYRTAYGEARAQKLLVDANALPELLKRCHEAYREAFSGEWLKYIQETADLVWICRTPGSDLSKCTKGSEIVTNLYDKYFKEAVR